MVFNKSLGVCTANSVGVQCTTYIVQLKAYSVQRTRTAYSVQCTDYSVQRTAYSVQCTVYKVQCKAYRLQHTVYNVCCVIVRFKNQEKIVFQIKRFKKRFPSKGITAWGGVAIEAL